MQVWWTTFLYAHFWHSLWNLLAKYCNYIFTGATDILKTHSLFLRTQCSFQTAYSKTSTITFIYSQAKNKYTLCNTHITCTSAACNIANVTQWDNINSILQCNASNEPNKMYLSDCKTAFMKHVLPRLRRPVVFGRKDWKCASCKYNVQMFFNSSSTLSFTSRNAQHMAVSVGASSHSFLMHNSIHGSMFPWSLAAY